MSAAGGAPVERLDAAVYTIPTDGPEADGTLAWDSTTIVVVEVHGGGRRGLGWTYGEPAVASLVRDELAGVVTGRDALDIPAAASAMTAALRNSVTAGLSAYAVSAVDVALWDLKARLLGVSLAALLGRCRDAIEVYGSGGFTSYPEPRLREQLGGWADAGFSRVKLKVGRDPEADPGRVRAAREAIGPGVGLMVDANGAWDVAAAVAMSHSFAEHGVCWLEEPVTSDDLDGLRRVRDRVPPGMRVAAGEYVTDVHGFRRMLDAGAVDTLQGDGTRCGGVTGLLLADALCRAHDVPFSAHCSPALHAHACVAMQRAVHVEYFHDHVRIERMLFDGVPEPHEGLLRPDPEAPGHGLELKRRDAERYARS